MAEERSLRLGIDSTGARQGGREVVRSLGDIREAAHKATAAVDATEEGMRDLKRTADALQTSTQRQTAALKQHAMSLDEVARLDAQYARQQESRRRAEAAAAGNSGREQAIALVDALEKQFAVDMARIKEGQARGFLTEAEAREAGREAAMAYNSGVVQVLDQASKTRALSGAAGQDAFIKVAGSIKNVGEESAKAGLGMHRLNNSLIVVARQAAGAHPVVGQLVDLIGTFAIGTAMMVPVLMGLAALAAAWKKITEEARKAKDELKKARDEAQNLIRVRSLGPDGELGASGKSLAAERDRLAGEIAALQRRVSGPLVSDPAAMEQRARDQSRLERLRAEFRAVARETAVVETEISSNRLAEHRRVEEERAAVTKAALDARIEREADAARRVAEMWRGVDARLGYTGGRDNSLGDPAITGGSRAQRMGALRNRALGTLDLGTKTARSAPGGITANAPGGLMAGIGQFVGGLKSGIAALLSSFGPLALAAAALKPVLEGIMEVLGPLIEAVGEPLAALGRIIGTQLKPAFHFLAVVVNQAVKIISYWAEGLGMVVKAIGWLIDKINIFGGDGGIGKFGQEMIDAARAARNNADAQNEAAAAARRLTTDVPKAVNLALYRSRIGSGGGVPSGSGTTWTPGVPPGGVNRHNPPASTSYQHNGNIIIQNNAGDSPEALVEKWERGVRERHSRGAVTYAPGVRTAA